MSNKYMYEQIYKFILLEISENKYKPGDKIPSELDFAKQFGVSRITSKKALEMLAMENIIVRKPGKGSFVTENSRKEIEEKKTEKIEIVPKEEIEKKCKKDIFIGLILPSFDSAYGSKIVLSIEEEVTKNGNFLILRRTHGDKRKEKKAIEEFLRIGVDAMIIFPIASFYFSEAILKLAVDKFNFVLIDRRLKDVPCISVTTNNKLAGKEVAVYLLDRNHVNLVVVGSGQPGVTAVEERMEGINVAYNERGIIFGKKNLLNTLTSMLDKTPNTKNITEDINKIKNHLTKYPEITSIIAIEYKIALLCERAIRELGMEVKTDISIICFDSSEDEYCEKPHFTYIRQNEEEIGRIAYEKVISMFSSNVEYEDIQVGYTLVKGESTN